MKIIELTSSESVRVNSQHSPVFINIYTNESVHLAEDEVGILVGKKSVSLRGAFCQPGIVHPGWRGNVEPFFIVYGEWTIKPGTPIAHLIIVKGE